MAKRVVVIGGGVVGLCCAYYLERNGHEVIVLDRGQPDSERCSSGNSGLVVPSHFVPLAAPGMISYGLRQMFNPRSPFRIKPQISRDLFMWLFKFWRCARESNVERAMPVLRDLNMLSRSLYMDFAKEAEFGFEQRGLLLVCKTLNTFEREDRETPRALKLGIETQEVSMEQLAKLDPTACYEAYGAIYYPQDCSLDPLRFTTMLRSRLRDVRSGVNVTALNDGSTGIQSVTADGDCIEADAFVLAGGVWSSNLVNSIGLHMPLQAGKGYSMTLVNSPSLPTIPSILVEGRVAITPMSGGLRVGGTMELGGTESTIDPQRVEGIVNTFCSYLPAYSPDSFKNRPVWKGLRPCSPDGVPYIGAFPTVPNLFAACGHAMMGLSLGPATGHLIAQEVSGRAPDIQSPLLRPDRF